MIIRRRASVPVCVQVACGALLALLLPGHERGAPYRRDRQPARQERRA